MKINLPNRYGYNNELDEVEPNLFVINLDKEILSVRVGINKENQDHFTFIDPPGGPIISVGEMVEDKKVKDIYFDKSYYIKFENE